MIKIRVRGQMVRVHHSRELYPTFVRMIDDCTRDGLRLNNLRRWCKYRDVMINLAQVIGGLQ